MNNKENETLKMHEVKQMTVEALQEYLKIVENDCCNLMKGVI